MEISPRSDALLITSEKREILLESDAVSVDGMRFDFTGEYERAGVGVEVRMVAGVFVATLHIERKNIAYIAAEIAEVPEDIVEFFGNIDILLLPSGRHITKLYEILEARIVIPFGESAHEALTALGQANAEPMPRYRSKESDFDADTTRFIYLSEVVK